MNPNVQALRDGDDHVRGGNGNGTNVRLNQLEKRVGIIEGEIKEITRLCVKIEAQVNLFKWIVGGIGIVIVPGVYLSANALLASPK